MKFNGIEKAFSQYKTFIFRCGFGDMRSVKRFTIDSNLKGFWWETFCDDKWKYEIALGILRKEKITIDPDDPAAMAQYAKVMKTIIEKTDWLSLPQREINIIEEKTKEIPDMRTYLLAVQDIRIRNAIPDDFGAEVMMFDALEKIEKEIKKPLLRDDKKGMALLKAELDKIGEMLGIRKDNIPKYDEELLLELAKGQVTEFTQEFADGIAKALKERFP
ncbi:hypothetical protein QJS10_CPA01g01390 [Acorus calamus]|uniref:Uncharacterized protein n=1 Tax=Acorus calamus TaxID=4465 RepID=A0AAV9FM80_ACOCL|nr:hypothetical protein QJS10_CPA01g01390 [Acorus calamus]